MEQFVADLEAIDERLCGALAEANDGKAREALVAVEKSAQAVGRAHSGSWIGSQASLYFKEFEDPPPDKSFDSMSGKLFRDQPEWIERSEDEVRSRIEAVIDSLDIDSAIQTARNCERTFEQTLPNVKSIISIVSASNDSYLEELLSKADDCKIPDTSQIIDTFAPNSAMTRDAIELAKGRQTPPHILVFAETARIRCGIDRAEQLSQIVCNAIVHIRRRPPSNSQIKTEGDYIFIGHGHSNEWLKLEKFLKDRLNLEVEEFDGKPPAGFTVKERLEQMLVSSRFAFLVLTAEDEIVDAKREDEQEKTRIQARMNVIHEAGLFQGRFGFDRAIILLEQGCEEFSNIHGLVHIPFPKNNITAAFEEIRRVLEDRGII